MFVNDTHLDHLLKSWHYTSPEFHKTEVERLFLPGWHLVGSLGEMSKPGDFVTADLFEIPIIVRNFDGEIRAFRNVCSHRNSLINSQRRGNLKAFKCQYHGWEYKADGSTGRIPEAKRFRPFDREKARLQSFPVAMCGDLVFVSLADNPPPLRDFIGERFDQIAGKFSSPSRHSMSWDSGFSANWKIPIENTLEAYHIPEIHPYSFMGVYPGEKHSTHSMKPGSSTLDYDLREFWLVYRLLRRGVKILGAEENNTYVHHHIHPGFVVIMMDLQAYAFAYVPVTHRTSKLRLIAYSFRGHRANPLAVVTWWISRFFGKRSVIQIAQEDAEIFADQQRGIEASHQPGCLGTLEERVHHFQKAVLDQCGSDGTPPDMQVTPAVPGIPQG